MSTQIAPSSGAGIIFTQGGVGASPGYAALDFRRADSAFITPGIVNTGSYLVSQRGAGANMSVDIAANAGYVYVPGSTIIFQGVYTVPPHSAVINETIAAADATNPRIDQVILRCYDNTIDGTGNNFARTEVLTGTPTVGATLVNRTGAAAFPANTMLLGDVLVPAVSTSVTNANIKDKRSKSRGKSIIGATESRTNVAYGLLATADQVTQINVPTDGLLVITYLATWQESVSGAGKAAIFLGINQITTLGASATAVQEVGIGGTAATYVPLVTGPTGLTSFAAGSGFTAYSTNDIVGSVITNPGQGAYDVSVQFKSTSGSVTVKNRQLKVQVWDPAMGPLS